MRTSQFAVRDGVVRPQLEPGTTLDELRKDTRGLCTTEQFEIAVATMGDDPYGVASFLCRHKYITHAKLLKMSAP